MSDASAQDIERMYELTVAEKVHGGYCLCDECAAVWEAEGLVDAALAGRIRLEEFLVWEEQRQRELDAMSYNDYLWTEEWRDYLRPVALARAGHRCSVCNAATHLHVHHRRYPKHRGQEQPDDLLVLCRDCHYLFHENRALVRA